jgi:hypothetical protein
MGSLVRLLALAASAVIALSLIMFAVDQSNSGTEAQLRSLEGQPQTTVRSQDEVDAPNPGPAAERAREAQHSSVREAIDDGNDLLAGPFTGVAPSDNVWVERLVPAALGLLLFGLGGLMLANWLPERRATHEDWRQAPS